MPCSSIPTALSIRKGKVHSGNVSHITTKNQNSDSLKTTNLSSSNPLISTINSNKEAMLSKNISKNSMKQNNVRAFSSISSNMPNSRYEEENAIKNTIALAVITRLHQWCCQLFWLTIICVMGACGDHHNNKNKTIQDIRKSITKSNTQKNAVFSISGKTITSNIGSIRSSKKSKNVAQIEIQLLRHLTCPQSAILRPITRSTKKRLASRPPSSQLFDIIEEELE
uniref:Uncharacterized protein n=1 Tax=Parastrongyloides trichosuri TaxID=131310 RepID=A0A0N4Z7U0_PARTI